MPDAPSPTDNPYVSRGGLKLHAALEAFAFDVTGLACADLGCSTGGFTDCLLQHGAAHVFSVDTAYGELAWKLRQDERVTVLERTNAVHFDLNDQAVKKPKGFPKEFTGVDLVVLDLGWTKQDRAIPAALRWLKRSPVSPAQADSSAVPSPQPHVITLIKPHYESGEHQLTDEQADAESQRVADDVLPTLGVEVLGLIRSPIRGGKGGNLEHLALLRPVPRAVV